MGWLWVSLLLGIASRPAHAAMKILRPCAPLAALVPAPNAFDPAYYTASAKKLERQWSDSFKEAGEFPPMGLKRLRELLSDPWDPDGEIYRLLGFSLDKDTGELVAPSFENFLKNYHAVLDALPEAQRKKVLQPGWQNEYSQFASYLAGGFEVGTSLTSASPHTVGTMLGQRLSPFSLGHRTGHDLHHLTGQLRFPDYSEALTTLQQAYAVGHRLSSADKGVRFGFLFESFAAVPVEKKKQLVELLGEKFAGDEKGLNLTELARAYGERRPDALAQKAKTLLASYGSLLNRYGGSARDGLRYDSAGSDLHPFLEESIASMAFRLQKALDGGTLADKTKLDLATELARFELSLFYSVGMTPEIYQRAAAETAPLAQENPVYRYFIKSGIGDGVGLSGKGTVGKSFAAPELKP